MPNDHRIKTAKEEGRALPQFSKTETVIVAIMLIAVLLALGYRVANAKGWFHDVASVEIAALPEEPKLDINKATLRELMLLPGIGPKTAEDIIRFREERGPFESVDSLDGVRGVGAATVNSIRRWVFVEPQIIADAQSEASPRAGEIFFPETSALETQEPVGAIPEADDRQPDETQLTSSARLNLNAATAEELMTLPSIGERLAEAIIEYREAHGPFRSLEDFGNVPRIGPSVIEKLRDLVRFD
ncbi:MAG: helix-hairpin-helix domain-containing protein [Planctomycetes bacterium]|nr:helix-hairpin-helix domain-containing protein [Planctomycetota bacterium]